MWIGPLESFRCDRPHRGVSEADGVLPVLAPVLRRGEPPQSCSVGTHQRGDAAVWQRNGVSILAMMLQPIFSMVIRLTHLTHESP